jgi:hypothetical protein
MTNTKLNIKTTKTLKKSKNNKSSLNIYVKNNRFLVNDEISEHLSKLTNFLMENEWLKVGDTDKLKDFVEDKQMLYFKPRGTWFSKGGWIFHDMCCNINYNIIYVQVDYSKIYRITGESPNTNPDNDLLYQKRVKSFQKKYSAKKLTRNRWIEKLISGYECSERDEKSCKNPIEDAVLASCKWNKKTKKCNMTNLCKIPKDSCRYDYGYTVYNWKKLKQQYDGFAIYPFMTREFMRKYQNTETFDMWDVESLVLFNLKPVITQHNLGSIKEILSSAGQKIKSSKSGDINYSKLTNGIIKKIKEIRKTL